LNTSLLDAQADHKYCTNWDATKDPFVACGATPWISSSLNIFTTTYCYRLLVCNTQKQRQFGENTGEKTSTPVNPSIQWDHRDKDP
jgi:hypothetical protein